VLSQTFQNFEVILIDDGSSEDIGSALKNLDPRVKYYQQENRGPAAARNNGIALATGEYLVFLDSDDVLVPTALASLHKRLTADPRVSIVHGWTTVIDETGPARKAYRPRLAGMVFRRYLYSNPTPLNSLMFRRQCFQGNNFFDPSLSCLEDWDLLLRLSAQYDFGYVAQEVGRVYIQERSRTLQSRISDITEAVSSVYAKLGGDKSMCHGLLGMKKRFSANRYVWCGDQYRLYAKDTGAARKEYLKAIKTSPGFVPAYKGLLKLLLRR